MPVICLHRTVLEHSTNCITMPGLLKKLRNVFTKTNKAKHPTSDAEVVLLRKELEEAKRRVDQAEESIQSLERRLLKLEKRDMDSGPTVAKSEDPSEEPVLSNGLVVIHQSVPSADADSAATGIPIHDGDMLSCESVPQPENNQRSWWARWKVGHKSAVYQEYKTSQGEFSNRTTGIQGNFFSASATQAIFSQSGGVVDAPKQLSGHHSIQSSAMISKAIQMAMDI